MGTPDELADSFEGDDDDITLYSDSDTDALEATIFRDEEEELGILHDALAAFLSSYEKEQPANSISELRLLIAMIDEDRFIAPLRQIATECVLFGAHSLNDYLLDKVGDPKVELRKILSYYFGLIYQLHFRLVERQTNGSLRPAVVELITATLESLMQGLKLLANEHDTREAAPGLLRFHPFGHIICTFTTYSSLLTFLTSSRLNSDRFASQILDHVKRPESNQQTVWAVEKETVKLAFERCGNYYELRHVIGEFIDLNPAFGPVRQSRPVSKSPGCVEIGAEAEPELNSEDELALLVALSRKAGPLLPRSRPYEDRRSTKEKELLVPVLKEKWYVKGEKNRSGEEWIVRWYREDKVMMDMLAVTDWWLRNNKDEKSRRTALRSGK
ncbi:hypothetical protein BJ508DRAFT_132632 [Ascobolus immersus RN42]|uniref:Uncharacterized protein n=1 Tax=Ascobolus immersus RN42 TaxID=1160509 RepID=A0A3N4I3G1_ASCIM|nr:hypothetical protein BJ508DRAFT_132632 [Ascobolus immersus RN42]